MSCDGQVSASPFAVKLLEAEDLWQKGPDYGRRLAASKSTVPPFEIPNPGI